VLAQYVTELEERQNFVEGIFEAAGDKDLSDEQLELVTQTRSRIEKINKQIEPLISMRQLGHESRQRISEIAKMIGDKPGPPREVEYRSVGEYVADYCRARALGDELAQQRLHVYQRAASHQTTADNPGLIPTPILGPVINFIDASRPLVGMLGPRQLPGATWSRPKVTQHTAVAAQSAEKAELTSQKMTITKLTVNPVTLGGYVNVSRQDLDWSQPQVLDIVITDLAAQYAILTEKTAVQAFYAGATAGGTIPATPTGDVVAGQFWAAAASVYTGTKGAGQIIAVASPDVLTELGPLFQPVNPFNQQGEGFRAANFGQGIAGYISGVPVIITSGFAAAKSLLLMSTAAAEVYEDRIGALQVIEPSVLGLQVAYAGYFADLIVEPLGIIKVTVT
jgi:HK97 family phage major capsid protein